MRTLNPPTTLNQPRQEVSSHPPAAQPPAAERGRGYTSDASDVVRSTSFRARRAQSFHARRHREGMLGSAPVHTAPHFSMLSSERVDFLNQSGELTRFVAPAWRCAYSNTRPTSACCLRSG